MPRRPYDRPYPVTQEFGVVHPRYSALGLAGHNGVDIGVPLLTPILAPADAVVIESAYMAGGFGYYVKLRTPAGEDWLLAHLSHFKMPQPGEWTPEGALIGLSGSSGLSTGPHLHIGYRSRWWVRGWPYDGYAEPPLSWE